MTDAQQLVLDLILKLNASTFSGWFEPSSVMAFVQVESAFRPHAFRQEPSGVASYGLMQILDATARGIGFTGRFEDLYDPETGLLWGMKYAQQIWDELARSLGHSPTMVQWASAYNEGPGNVLRGRDDSAYAIPWLAAKAHWASVDATPSPIPPPPQPPAPPVDIHALVVMIQQALRDQGYYTNDDGTPGDVDGKPLRNTCSALSKWYHRKS